MDEPTTGLHFEDIRKLIGVLNRLADAGNTLVVIEHNLDVIKCADWLIDLGPEGGEGGGRVIATGTPEQVAKSDQSFTATYLRRILAQSTKSIEPKPLTSGPSKSGTSSSGFGTSKPAKKSPRKVSAS